MIKTIKDAEDIAGRLSKPSKMPGYAYGIPAKRCLIGSKLRGVKNSVCSKCYALKGRYGFSAVARAQEFRFASLTRPEWVDAMVFMIKARKCDYFRWHDSGDLQSLEHLEKIAEVCRQCPETKFWLPTREMGIVSKLTNQPANLCIRLSAHLIDTQLTSSRPTSSVVSKSDEATCQASINHTNCGSCRACWDPGVKNVAYLKH